MPVDFWEDEMPSVSDSQRRFFGAVLAAKRGQSKNPSAKVKKAAASISERDAADFARKKKRQGVVKTLMS